MVGCWRCCGVRCVVCDVCVQVVVWCVYVHVVLCWWCVGVVCVCMWCCAWVLCGGGGVVRCVGVVLVLCWCGVVCVCFFLSFSLFSLNYLLSLSLSLSLSVFPFFLLFLSSLSLSLSKHCVKNRSTNKLRGVLMWSGAPWYVGDGSLPHPLPSLLPSLLLLFPSKRRWLHITGIFLARNLFLLQFKINSKTIGL